MKIKNVCIISKFLYENDTRLQQQVAILAEEGFSVDVICQLEEKKSINVNAKVNIYGVSIPGDKDTITEYIFNMLKFGLPAFFKLQKLSFTRKYDLIIVHTLPELLVFTTIIQKLFGSKIILDIRDTSVELFDSKWSNGNRNLLRKVVTIFANLSCKYADKLLVASPGFKDKLLDRNVPAKKIIIVFNSADSKIFKFDKNRNFEKIDSNLKLIYHGSIAERFGLDVALEAVYYVNKKIPDTKLNIYGFYDKLFRTKLEKMVEKFDLNNNVFFNQRESLESIYHRIKDAHIGIVPYKNDFFMQLAFSTKLFEYVSSGIPVVTSRLKPAESVFTEDSIFFVKSRDSQELADKIVEICNNPEVRQAQVNKGFEKYSKISDSIMKERFINVVKEMIV